MVYGVMSKKSNKDFKVLWFYGLLKESNNESYVFMVYGVLSMKSIKESTKCSNGLWITKE
jgi:hypothetical protein